MKACHFKLALFVSLIWFVSQCNADTYNLTLTAVTGLTTQGGSPGNIINATVTSYDYTTGSSGPGGQLEVLLPTTPTGPTGLAAQCVALATAAMYYSGTWNPSLSITATATYTAGAYTITSLTSCGANK